MKEREGDGGRERRARSRCSPLSLSLFRSQYRKDVAADPSRLESTFQLSRSYEKK